MAVSINPINLNPSILDTQDQNLVASKELTRYFGLPQDYIQLYVYNNNDVLLNSIPNFQKYSITDNKVVNFDPELDIQDLGYSIGTFNMYYNFLRPIVTINSDLDLFIQNISQDRTEVKIATTLESNDVVYSNAINYIDTINTRDYFVEFYLDLGQNILIPASTFSVEKDVLGNINILVKLINPLPTNITVKSPLNIVEKIVDTQGYNAFLTQTPTTVVLPSLRQANFSLNVDDQRIGSSDYYNFNQLTALTGSNNPQLQNLLGFISSSNPTINVDYTDYSNFTHFGSQTQKLSTFKTKIQKLELYNNYLPSSSLDNIVYQNKINEIIEGFDGYETYLYFESTSFAWPKSNTQPPFNLYSSTSSQAINWYNLNYTSASYYDEFNNNNLVYGLPIYLQERDDFEYVKPFIHSMGQVFDDIWIYIRAITDIWKAKNSLMDGISKDLVGDALQSLGISLYTDGDQDDLATYLYGVNQSGSYTFMSQPWQTAITASNPTLSGQDEAKSVFKRIYANLPTLLKSKGTTKFVNYLTTLYGIPDTVLVPLEFGGVDKDSNTIEYSYPKFTYALSSSKTTYTQLSLPDSTKQQIQTLEFRFKPYPSASLYATQSLFSNFATGSSKRPNSIITLNGKQSGSYQYGTLNFYSNDSGLALYNTPLQVTLPFYVTGSDGDYNWWNVVLERNSTTTRLYVKSELSGEIGHQSSSFTSTPSSSRFIETGSNTYLGTIPPNITASLINAPFYNFGTGEYYGQFQELKAYNNFISESVINTHTLNPESYVGNNSNSAYNDLLFRFPLGNDLQISGSRITGSQPTLRSDITLNLTGSNYISFTEMYHSQPAIGGYSVPVTNKIRIVSESLASNILQFNKSVVYPSTSSRTFDVQTAQAGFSPQDQINNDIIAHLGNTYNLDNIIGDPLTLTDSSYEALSRLQENYFTKYNTTYNYKDFLILMETFHKSLFRYLNDFTPARTDMSSGVIIKPHILERNKVARHEPNVSTSSVYFGETEVVTIEGSNPGDYCCSRNSPLNEAFYTGNISGSTINLDSAYEQLNPFTSTTECYEYTIQYDGLLTWLDCNNIQQASGSSGLNQIQIVALKDQIGHTFGTGYTIVNSNSYYGTRFVQQYGGYDALNNNVDKAIISQFKFKKLNTQVEPDTRCTCVRYDVNSLDVSNAHYLSYVDCGGNIQIILIPNALSGGRNILIDACEGSLYSFDGPGFLSWLFVEFIFQPSTINVLKSGSVEFQDSLLTETSWDRSRVEGVKLIAPGFNQFINNYPSLSFSNVEITTPYMLFYDWASNTLPERQNTNNFHIRYLIDETGKIYSPEPTGSEYYDIVDQGFGAYDEVNYTLYNATYYQQSSKSATVHRPLRTYSTILYSDTGSWNIQNSNKLAPGYFSPINFQTPDDFKLTEVAFTSSLSGDISKGYDNNPFTVNFNNIQKQLNGIWNPTTNTYTITETPTNQVNISATIDGYFTVQVNTAGGSNNVDITYKLCLKRGPKISILSTYTTTNSVSAPTIPLTTYNRSLNGTVSANNQNLYAGDEIYITADFAGLGSGFTGQYNGFISDDNTIIKLQSNTTLNTAISTVYTPYWYPTSSANVQIKGDINNPQASDFEVRSYIITGSLNFQNMYQNYQQNPNIPGTTLNSGFSDPLLFTIQPNDEFRFNGDESKIYTVITASISMVDNGSGYLGSLWVQLDKNPSLVDTNYFVIRRLTDDPGFIMINTKDSQGPGFILPKYPSSTLKKNFSNIVQDLASKNLLI